MGRGEVGLKCIEVRSLLEKRAYEEAYQVAETINLDRVTSIVDLKVIASVYERLGKYEDAKEILLRSYEKKPTKMVVYRLSYLSVKTKEFEDAEFFYQEFSNMAPKSSERYILRYGIDRAKGVDYYLRIATLQKLKKIDYMEEWGYELAKVYHKAGLYDECIEECNDLILWFGEGTIVEKAKLLRKYHLEGRESLDVYGVFDDGLTEEELQERREQFIADTTDLAGEAAEAMLRVEEKKIRKQLDLDLEKTVDLRRVIDLEGKKKLEEAIEERDLLKQDIHRGWGYSEAYENKEANILENIRTTEQQAFVNAYSEYQDPPTTEQMIAASVAEVMNEEQENIQYEAYDQGEGYIQYESYEPNGEYAQYEGYELNEEYAQYEGYELNGEYVPYEGYEQNGEYVPYEGYEPNGEYAQYEGYEPNGEYVQYEGYEPNGEYVQYEGYEQNGEYVPYEGYNQNIEYEQKEAYEQEAEYVQNEEYEEKAESVQNEEYEQNIESEQNEEHEENAEYVQNEEYEPNIESEQNEEHEENAEYEQETEYIQSARTEQNIFYVPDEMTELQHATEVDTVIQKEETVSEEAEDADIPAYVQRERTESARPTVTRNRKVSAFFARKKKRKKKSNDFEIMEETTKIPVKSIEQELAKAAKPETVEQETVIKSVSGEVEQGTTKEFVAEATEQKPTEETAAEATEQKPSEETVAEVTEQKPSEETVAEATEQKPSEETVAEATEQKPSEETVAEATEQSTSATDEPDKVEEPEEQVFMHVGGVDLWEFFSAYEKNEILCESLYDSMLRIKKGERPLNFIVTCKDKERSERMAKDIAKALERLGIVETRKVSRISAEKLNMMHLEQSYDKLLGHCLLVESAKKITPDTAQSIMNMINEIQDKVVVILADARPFMSDMLNEYKMMKRYFPFDINVK